MEKILYLLQGPPAAGKSTWTDEFVKDNPDTVVVSRDTIRYEVGNGVYNHKHEAEVTKREEKMTIDAMKDGKTIISDNTNLNPKYLNRWYDLAKEYGYEVVKKEFYVPYRVSLERCKKRTEEGGHPVSKKSILMFYKLYYREQLEKEMTDYRIDNMAPWSESLPTCVICDLDYTIAMHTGRTAYEFDRIPEDKIDTRLALTLELFTYNNVEIIFLTGRPDNVRCLTKEWLDKHFHHEYKLIMRDANDYSKGPDTKKALYEKYIDSKYNVLCVFDDSNKCVEMWRSLGLLTLQVQNGDY